VQIKLQNVEYPPQQPNSFNSSSYPCLFGNSHTSRGKLFCWSESSKD